MKKFPHVVRDNFEIYSFYGTFPKAIWNGGRVSVTDEKSTVKFMEKVRDFYNKKGIKVTFTFTNSLIEAKHLKDEYCNQILDVFHNGINEVLVVSPILEDYIRDNYPKYKINKSITFADAQNPYNTNRYHLSVIDKSYNNNFEKLKKIHEKEKIEVLCDEWCVNNCKYTKEHYTEIGAVQLGIIKNNEYYGKCRYLNRIEQYNMTYFRNKNSNYYITSEDIIKKYIPLGFKYFKLSGREKFNIVGYESIINYLFKPEYQNDIKTYIYESLIMDVTSYYNSNVKLITERCDYI